MPEVASEIQAINFRSHGKLLISGEYLVLKGALALAVPLKMGQTLEVLPLYSKDSLVHWQTWHNKKLLLDVVFEGENLDVVTSSGLLDAATIKKILIAAKQLNPDFIRKGSSYKLISKIEFDMSWGFGSSSTLISNMAFFSETDPFQLNKMVFGGSGYDIACSRSSKPMLYSLKNDIPHSEAVAFDPEFKEQLYIVFSGKKQNSRKAVNHFMNQKGDSEDKMRRVSHIAKEMALTGSLERFESLMEEHEAIISDLLGVPPVKQLLFADFQGKIKSLGAWGGDCWLVTSRGSREELAGYFNNKGFNTIFSFGELIRV